jgi:hypothetical protein
MLFRTIFFNKIFLLMIKINYSNDKHQMLVGLIFLRSDQKETLSNQQEALLPGPFPSSKFLMLQQSILSKGEGEEERTWGF